MSEPKLHPRDCTCTLCGLRSDPEKDNFHEFLYYGDYSCGSTGPLAPAKPLAQINDRFYIGRNHLSYVRGPGLRLAEG